MEMNELAESILTVAHAYDYASSCAFYGMTQDGFPVDREVALANSIGWASRNQEDIIYATTD